MSSAYPFSVVIPAYNVEPFITAAIESVIAQDIGFSNIQLILVDDGSTDGTDKIIDRYAKKYPDNIIALHQKNAGVSAARNAGLALAVGKYVNCLDSDDMWESHVFSRVFSFFEEHYDETDIVSCPIYHFTESPDKNEPHYLNHKFKKGSRVILLDKEPNAIQYACNSAFFKRQAIKLPFFEPGLAFSEDVLALQRFLMGRLAFGVVANCPYWYRRRSGESEPSALQRKYLERQWYCDRLERVFLKLEHESLAKFQTIPRFIQYAVCNDLFWVLQTKRIPSEAGLNSEEIDRFYRLIRELLRQVEDEIILTHIRPGATFELRFLAFQLKYGREPILTPLENDFMVGFPPEAGQINRFSSFPCVLDFLSVRNDVCTLEGRFMLPAGIQHNGLCIIVKANGVRHEAKMSVYQDAHIHISMGIPTLYQHIFQAEIPLDPKCGMTDLKLMLEVNGVSIPLRKPSLGRFFPLTNRFSKAFCILGGVKCTLFPGGAGIRLSRRYSAFLSELRFMKELWRVNRGGYRETVLKRAICHIRRFFKRKPLWLCSDRPEKADDNGEVFFEYLRKNHPEIDSRFVLNRDSPDWDRLKKIGPVVEAGSRKHKLLRLLSDCCVSSHPEDYAVNILRYSFCYQDILIQSKNIFLQHGVIKDDLSSWLHKSKQNLAGFVTTTPREQQSILGGNYGYSGKEVWLTGLPRHDRLYNDPKKKITVMPTWRKELLGPLDPGHNLKPLAPLFYSSSYRKFLHDLLNHERLLKCAEDHGYQLCFLPHPQLQKYVAEFGASPSVLLYGFDREVSYREVFAESDLVVTDYSSAVFDFAWLKKPVIYAQFDKEDFYVRHNYSQGYFDYERDGFGEVEYDLESTVDRIIEYMESGCRLKDRYRERIDSFFAFHDQNNCQRVFEKIVALEGGSSSGKA